MKTVQRAVIAFLFILFTLAGCYMSEAERDNINDPESGDYRISAEVTPASLSTVAGHEDIVIKFTDRMDPSSVVLGGDIIAANTNFGTAGAWSKTVYDNDTLTIKLKDLNTKAFWPKGDGKVLTVDGKTAEGMAIPTVNVTYNVVYRIYVRKNGADANTGTKGAPVETISMGIQRASVIYAGSASDVCVSKGDYTTNWGAGTSRIVMIEGVSLYGGYDENSENRDAALNHTTITDGSTAGGASWINPNRTVDFSSSAITNATVIDGFTITGGGSDAGGYAAAILCYNGASPSIQNNTINGGSLKTGITHGIISSSSPVIQNNIINGGEGNIAAAGSSGYSFGIYSDLQTGVTCSIEIKDNIINGGNGYNSYGMSLSYSADCSIQRNKISGGQGDQKTYGIFVYSLTSFNLFNNMVFGGTGKNETCGIYCRKTPAKIFNNTIDGGRSVNVTPVRASGIYLYDSSSSPQIKNNILFITHNTSNGYGVYEGSAFASLAFENNDIFYYQGGLYYDSATGAKTAIADVNSLGSGYSANISIQASFINYNNTISWNNANLHITAGTDVTIRTGGLDDSASAWGFTDDKDKTARTGNGTTGWSMGAYEQD